MLKLWGTYKHWTKGTGTRGLRAMLHIAVMTEMKLQTYGCVVA